MICPLCHSGDVGGDVVFFYENTKNQRLYYDCTNCKLIFLQPAQQLTLEAEKRRYLLHNNDVSDIHYQNFVSDLENYVKENFAPGKSGLDFGAGTGPVLSMLLKNSGYLMSLYDPFFHADEAVLKVRYDFIVSCEVVEHFNCPRKEFDLLNTLLKKGAALVIKTHLYNDSIDFSSWYYPVDPTHISFYREETLQWIKNHYGYSNIVNVNHRTIAFWK